ncbi:MAG: peptidoglycan DD-metalloendopeptidase family protein [Hyphomonas sp.]
MSIQGLVLLALGWSGAVWLAAHLICRMKPSPEAAQAIWRGAGLMMLAPFAASLVVPGLPKAAVGVLPDLPVLEPLRVAPEPVEFVTEATAMHLPQAGTILLGLIVTGWAVRLAFWIASQVRLQRIKAHALRSSRDMRHWAEAVGLRHNPRICFHKGGQAFLAGIFRRAIYVPYRLAFAEDAYHVVVHEMVHLKRGDLVLRPLERLVADIFWFSPFAWWIRGQLDYWREAVVDAETAELVGDRIAYARTLTTAARLSRIEAVLPVAAFTLRKEGTLKMRLNELLSETARRPRRLGMAAAAALVLATPLALAQGMLIKGAAAGPGTGTVYSHALLDEAKLTSPFGVRKHPITGETKKHAGVDLAFAEGVPVYAPATGTVTKAEMKDAYGNMVELALPGDTVMRFAQLKEMDVAAGDAVSAGDVIGLMGQSGQATGPHLHFELWRAGATVDPEDEPGLVLATKLHRPAAPAAPEAPATPRDVMPAPVVPPARPAAAPAPVAPVAETPAACKALETWAKETPMKAAWKERMDVSREANKAAGLKLDRAWKPEALAYPAPSYPPEAASNVLSGACRVMFDLGTEGLPKNVTAECSDPVFEASAAELPGARFKPVVNEAGQPVEVKGIVYPLEYCIG